MIIKAVYDSLDAIPEAYRPLFKQTSDGKWTINASEIENIDDVVAPGLKQNRETFRQERDNARQQADSERQRANNLEAELSRTRTPGSVVLGEKDAKLWREYTELGTVSDIQKLKTENADYKAKLETVEREDQISKVIKETGNQLNEEVVKDFLSSPRGEGIVLKSKKVIVKDAKGVETTEYHPIFVKQEKTGENTFKETEFEAKSYADENLPSYLAASLFQNADANQQNGTTSQQTKTTTGVKMPVVSGKTAQTSGTEEPKSKSRIEQFNANRSTRPDVFGINPTEQKTE